MSAIEFQTTAINLQSFLLGLAMKWLKDYNEAEELVQHTITKAFANKHRFKDGSNFKAWISTILYNDFINSYRKKKRRRAIVSQEQDWFPMLSNLPDRSSNADDNLLLKELEKVVAELEEVLRTPFMMYFQGYRYQEISEELDIPLGTVKSRIYFARKKLKQKINQQYGGYPLEKVA